MHALLISCTVACALHKAVALVHPLAAQPFSTWMADSIIARNQGHNVDGSGNAVVNYEHGEFQQALRAVFAVTNNTKYSSYIQTGIDKVVSSSGAISSSYNQSRYSLDDLRIGPSFIKLYQSTGSSKYLTATQTYRKHLNGQPRNTKGGYWHRGSSYPYQMWLDGIYMAQPFYGLVARDIENNNATAYADVENQFKLLYANAFDNTTKLLKHGYFDRAAPSSVSRPVWADTVTGACPHVWDRAVGWYVMALADLLTGPDAIPTSTSAYTTLLTQFRQLIPALVTNADPSTGAWWLVLTAVGKSGNYLESSGTSMFVYAMLKAVSSGLVPDSNGAIRAAAIKAYNWLATKMVIQNSDGTLGFDGTVNVGSLGSNGTFEYYIAQPITLNDLKGSAAFVLASVEYEKL